MARTPVQQLLIAYTVDLICISKELFIKTLYESIFTAVTITWVHLQKAFEDYGLSNSPKRVHESIRSNTTQDGQTLTAEDFRTKVRELLGSKP